MGPMARRSDGDNSRQAEWHQLLAHPTRLAIIRALGEGPQKIAELADAAGVHPNTVRSHLDRLEKAGVLAVDSLRRGGRGRPTKQYRLREPVEAGSAPAGDTPRLLMKAIVSLSQRADGQSAVDVATEEGFRLGRELGERFVPAEGDEHDWMVDFLDHLSFAPRIRDGHGRTEIDLLHCPFWGGPAEENGDVVCSFHLGMLQGAVETAGQDPQTVELAPFVDSCCCRVTIGPTG